MGVRVVFAQPPHASGLDCPRRQIPKDFDPILRHGLHGRGWEGGGEIVIQQRRYPARDPFVRRWDRDLLNRRFDFVFLVYRVHARL